MWAKVRNVVVVVVVVIVVSVVFVAVVVIVAAITGTISWVYRDLKHIRGVQMAYNDFPGSMIQNMDPDMEPTIPK